MSCKKPVFRIRIRIRIRIKFVSWIRIRIPNADPDPAADKLAPKAKIIHIIYSYLTNFNIFFILLL
jgi:hypothetical protein